MEYSKNTSAPSSKRVYCKELNLVFESSSKASKYLGHCVGYVSGRIAKNKKTTEGYTFEYI